MLRSQVWFNNRTFTTREARGGAVRVSLFLYRFVRWVFFSLHCLRSLPISNIKKWVKHSTCVVASQYRAEEPIKGHVLQWSRSDKDLWCVENRVGWAPSSLLELWLLMHQHCGRPCHHVLLRAKDIFHPQSAPFNKYAVLKMISRVLSVPIAMTLNEKSRREKNYSGW